MKTLITITAITVETNDIEGESFIIVFFLTLKMSNDLYFTSNNLFVLMKVGSG
jgi:hypothetical protein